MKKLNKSSNTNSFTLRLDKVVNLRMNKVYEMI